MSRLHYGLVLALSLTAGYARAQTQAEIANKENEEGKQLMFAGKFAEASAKFQDAVARVPEAKYFFNLCTALYQEGKFGEALTACNSVEKNGGNDEQKAKTAKLEDKIRDEAKVQGIDLQPTGGGGGGEVATPDPNVNNSNPVTPDPNAGGVPPPNPNGGTAPVATPPPQPQYAVGRPPSGVSVFAAAPPEHHYTWSLGVDLFGGGGKLGGKDASGEDIYGHVAGGIRIKSDYMLNPRAKLGVEGYLQITHLNAGQMQTNVSSLDLIDVGIAGFKHLCPRGVPALCLTPLVGVHLSLMSPANEQDSEGSQVFNYAALGGRAELAASFAFGRRYEHVLSLEAGINVYSAVFASPSSDQGGIPASMIGLDSGGAFAYLGLGYTYRFNTPFGAAPFVTLE